MLVRACSETMKRPCGRRGRSCQTGDREASPNGQSDNDGSGTRQWRRTQGRISSFCRGHRKEFPGVVALDDVSFRLKRGTVHALMGENGAGKSTLMKILAGIYTPDKGEVKFKGVPISN
jgi:ABC-type glutathione transport system ATPase component